LLKTDIWASSEQLNSSTDQQINRSTDAGH
jgi:hypothetical protein